VFRAAIFLLAFLAFGVGMSSAVEAKAAVIKSYKELNPAQKMDLELSEDRLNNDDRILLNLERDRKNKKISEQDYESQYHDLVNHISAEACLQNEILTKHPQDFEFPEGAAKVLRTVGKYSINVVASALASLHFSFSP
jgi:hypothetical protein